MSKYITHGVLLIKAQELCCELRAVYRDRSHINSYPLENLVTQLQGIENELEFMTRCFNDLKTGECTESNAREHISLGIGRLVRDLEDLQADMKNKNHNPVNTVHEPLGATKGRSEAAYRARDFYVSTKWRAIEAVKRSKRNLQVRYENMTKSQGAVKIPASRKGSIRSRLTFTSLSQERGEYLRYSNSLPTPKDWRGRGENPEGLHQRANSVTSDPAGGHNIYDHAWEEMGRRIRLAQERITHSNRKVPAEEKTEEGGKEGSAEP